MKQVLVIAAILAAALAGVLLRFVMPTDEAEPAVIINEAPAPQNIEVVAVPPVEESLVVAKPLELPPISLAPKTVKFSDGTETTFHLAEPFEIAVAAEGLGKARFMTMSPEGRIFVPDMVDYNLSHEGKIIILDDFNEKIGQFQSRQTYLSGLRGPHSIAFYTDRSGKSWIYLTLTEHLLRYPYQTGDMTPSGEPEVIATFPNSQTPGATGTVWHITRTILFQDDVLYVSVGSGCNSCEQEGGDRRALILAMDPDGGNARVYADGIKNAVGLKWVDGSLYATENGADHLGPDAPNDLMYRVEEGKHYGWPYCYELNGAKYLDTSLNWQREPIDCKNTPLSFADFEPHSAPLGFEYFENANAVLNNSFIVALQGSWQPEIGSGYQLVRVSRDGEQEVFLDGFQADSGERFGRPVGVLQKDGNSFFVSDDFNGRMYYIYARK